MSTAVRNWRKTTRGLALWLIGPALAIVIWGELTPAPPPIVDLIWDKALHFTAYFGLAALATLALSPSRRLPWTLAGLVLLGGLLEVIQWFTGRDPSIYDEIANILGVLAGTGVVRMILGRHRVVEGRRNLR